MALRKTLSETRFFFSHSWAHKIPLSQVGFAELKETADDCANIGGTIIGAPIVGQQLAQYILTDHQDADDQAYIVAPIVGLFTTTV